MNRFVEIVARPESRVAGIVNFWHVGAEVDGSVLSFGPNGIESEQISSVYTSIGVAASGPNSRDVEVLRDPSRWPSYALLTFNCEHALTFALGWDPVSPQVSRALRNAAVGGALVTLADALASESPSWPVRYALWEVSLLGALGFGLDLGRCAASGMRSDLAYVSPRTGRAVSRSAGAAWADRLLPLPQFLLGEARATIGGVRESLRLTGHFLDTWMLPAFEQPALPQARDRLISLLETHEMPPETVTEARDDEAEYHRAMGETREIRLPGG